MTVSVTTQISIKRPRDEVAEYSSNPDNAPEWYENIKSVEWRTPRPLALRTQVAFKAKFLGRELAYVYEIAELDPGHKLVMRTADGPFPMETTYVWESVDEQTTRMTLTNRGDPSGFSKFVALIMSMAMKRANSKDLKRLRQILEM
jgi:uncharacterized membrane protein